MSTPSDQDFRLTVDDRGRSRWRRLRWGAAVLAVLVIATVVVLGSRLDKDPTLVDSPLIGKPAPTRQLPLLKGDGSLSLADLRGRVVVVNFWASWCGPCRAEHPALTGAATVYRDSGVMFVGVNYQDKRSAALGFLDDLGWGDPAAYRYVTDPGSRLAVDFGVFGIPETFFLDRNGTIVAKISGQADYAILAKTLDAILAGRDADSTNQGPVQRAPGS